MTGPEVTGGGVSGEGRAGALHVLRADGAEEVEPARAAAYLQALTSPGVPLTWVHGDRRSELLDGGRHHLPADHFHHRSFRNQLPTDAVCSPLWFWLMIGSLVGTVVTMVVYFRRQHWW
jgi:hypothetical protein